MENSGSAIGFSSFFRLTAAGKPPSLGTGMDMAGCLPAHRQTPACGMSRQIGTYAPKSKPRRALAPTAGAPSAPAILHRISFIFIDPRQACAVGDDDPAGYGGALGGICNRLEITRRDHDAHHSDRAGYLGWGHAASLWRNAASIDGNLRTDACAPPLLYSAATTTGATAKGARAAADGGPSPLQALPPLSGNERLFRSGQASGLRRLLQALNLPGDG